MLDLPTREITSELLANNQGLWMEDEYCLGCPRRGVKREFDHPWLMEVRCYWCHAVSGNGRD
jgi:hypothetical protein